MDGSNNSTLPCLMYETFGDCKYAINCRRSHNVSSYPTQKEIGTVVFKTNDIPGVVEFHAGAEKSKSTKYYIAKDPWFTAKAGSGDYVELTISEKKFQDTDFHHARVTKILESASVSRNRPNIGLRSTHRQKHWPLCKEFMTYSSCESGTRCNHRHDVDTAYEQSFYIAKITLVLPVRYNSYEVEVERREHGGLIISRKYRLPERDRNVSEGNLVILQGSSQIYQRRRSSDVYYGKIAAVLHNSQKLEENDIPLEKKMKLGFMFRIPESQGSSARKIVSAYSIESCANHDSCKRIGIHIRASSLGGHFIKLNKYFVPFYRSKGSHKASGFNIDSIRFALSIYAHSACSSVEGPSLTPLVIRPGYCYTVTDASKYQSYLKEMWEVFVKDSFFDIVVNSLASNDIATNPETWRERIVMRQTIDFFNKEIVKFLRSKSEKLVIARNVSPKLGIASKDMVISAENLRMIEINWQSPHTVEEREKTLGFFLGLAKRTEEEYWDEMLSDRYIWEVLSCDSLDEGHSVIATSPIGQVVDFVNQQTVLSLMVSPHSTLYTRNDILGILVRRYHTPVILKSVVRYLSKRLLEVQFSGIFGRRRGNPVCTHKEIFPGSILSCLDPRESQRDSEDLQVVDDDNDDKPIENLSLILEGLSCEEYSNSKLVCLSGEKMAQLAQTSIKYGVEAGETADEIRELIATKTEYDSPYKLHEKGTIVTLSRGVELQLQVSMEGDDMEFDHWLRLLRVGKDCHLCLIHLNTPDRAFLSGRRDVKEVMLKNATEIIDKKVASNSLKTMTLKKMDIKWSDAYFSGGTFISTVPIKPQSLLCIRKEIIAADMNTLFVWTCHAVVSEVRENEVTFLTCSVFQDQTANMWENDDNGHFIIEILDVEDKPASQSASS